MGNASSHKRVLSIMAAFSQSDQALEWGRRQAEQHWGPVHLASDVFSFDYTTYYEKSMGPHLKKVLWAFERLIDPPELVARKHQANRWEAEYANESQIAVDRPLNLDPGYLTEAKLVLATTKDRDHRIYLDQGIFAEVTLHYQRGSWRTRDWTYADYASKEYGDFFICCRDYLRTVDDR